MGGIGAVLFGTRDIYPSYTHIMFYVISLLFLFFPFVRRAELMTPHINGCQARVRLIVDAGTWNFGTVASGTMLRHTFVLFNGGPDTLRILSTKTSTGADMAWMTKHALAANDTAHMKYM